MSNPLPLGACGEFRRVPDLRLDLQKKQSNNYLTLQIPTNKLIVVRPRYLSFPNLYSRPCSSYF